MKKKRIHFCNVLESRPATRHLWNFVPDRNQPKLEKEQDVPATAPLPEKLTQKDWSDLVRPRLNVAWLPPGQVFLRVVQLPAADQQELLSMLEFQLEKLSPLPVTHVVWSLEVLPSQAEKMQTAVVCIVSRDAVEQFVGNLEQSAYQPDRLEIPQLNQILAHGVREDGAWIYMGEEELANFCTVAWWAGGTLQQVQLIHLPEGNPAPAAPGEETAPISPADLLVTRANFLREQLMQIAWAGELEGWLNPPVRWHLVASEPVAEQWEPLIREWTEEGVDTSRPMTRQDLARFSGNRVLQGIDGANLLPAEFSVKYRQQFIDRLWMGGLGALIGVYALGVVIYIIALQFYSFRQTQVQEQVGFLSETYTNVLQLREQVEVLQDQLNLKYAALDSWKVASELLPADFTLSWLVLSRGQTLQLQGTAPADATLQVTEYNEAIRNATVSGQRLFSFVTTPNIQNRPGSQGLSWQFNADLRLADVE